MTKEHPISQSVFDSDFATVRGPKWDEKNDVRIPLNSLCTKNLCAKHNNDLSMVDTYGGKLRGTLKRAFDLMDIRVQNGLERSGRFLSFPIDSNLTTRWCLKAAIGAISGGWVTDLKSWQPPDFLAQIAFGLKKFDSGTGLGVLATVGENYTHTGHFMIATLKRNKEITGVLLTFSPIRFVLTWDLPLVEARTCLRQEDPLCAGEILPVPGACIKLPSNIRLLFR